MDSLISEHHADDEIASGDDHHVTTRMQTIAGRHNPILKTVDKVSALLSRNMSHMRARAATTSTPPVGDMVIGVSIEQATVEVETDYDHVIGRATAYAEGSKQSLRSRPSWITVPDISRQRSLRMKTNAFTQKFRRKSGVNSDIAS